MTAVDDEAPPRHDRGFDRTPPQDIPAEQCVLGGMLLSKDAIADVVEILRTADFYRPAHATIFDAILDLYGRGEPADAITVAAALADSGNIARTGGVPYLHDLIAIVPTAANAGYYAKIVAERAVLRRLVEAGTRIVQLGYAAAGTEGRDADETVDLAQQTIYDVTRHRTNEDLIALSELLQPAVDEIEAAGAHGGLMTGIPTGFADLDRLLNGLHAGQLIIVAGRPGLGKALALDTLIPTPAGWTTMGELQVGQEVFDAGGRATTVRRVFDVLHGRTCYRLTFSDGSAVVADGEHQWSTKLAGPDDTAQVRTTEEIAATRPGPARGAGPRHLLYPDLFPAQFGRSIVAVDPVASVPVRCISVDNPDRLYLCGPTGVPTHNSTAGMDLVRAAAVRNNLASAIFSLEMSKIEIVLRLLSAEARVPLHVLRSGRLSDDDWTKLARRMGEISEAPLFVDDTPNMTLMEIRAKARRLKQRNDLKLIVVDYLQLMTPIRRSGQSREQEVAELSRGLKLLAKEVECPVVAVSQLNRGPEQRTDKRPNLSDLRDSGAIEQDADVVILLHREDYYDKETPRAGEADFIVAKHRNGPTDTITVAAQLHLSRFVDMAVA